jgi:MFS family permease
LRNQSKRADRQVDGFKLTRDDGVMKIGLSSSPEHMESSALEQTFIRNVAALAACEMLWGFGIRFSSETAILPILLRRLGASAFVIGFVPAISLGGMVMQIFSGYFSERMRTTRRFVVWARNGAVLPWVAIGALLYIGGARGISHGTFLVFILLLFALMRWTLLFSNAPYVGLIGRSLHMSRRGFGYGLIFALNTLAGILGALIAATLLERRLFWWYAYALCFGVSFLCGFIGNHFILLIKEPTKTPHSVCFTG